jgi:hypothetical protein
MTAINKRSAKPRAPRCARNVEPAKSDQVSGKRVTRQAHLVTMLQTSGGITLTNLNAAMR